MISASEKFSKTQYRTYFGECPTTAIGNMTLELVKNFEENGRSLRLMKEKIVKEQFKKKFYLSEYKINYNPLTKYLTFSYDCPRPLMKVSLYSKHGALSGQAILVESGELFNLSYEYLLRKEKKLKSELPSLAIPTENLNEKVGLVISNMIKNLDRKIKNKLSEVILDDDGDLTIIFSFTNQPLSAFFGKNNWQEKSNKLQRIISYMKAKKRLPTIVNLTNSKKVVVKFSDRF